MTISSDDTLCRLLEDRLSDPSPILWDRGTPVDAAVLLDHSRRLASALASMGVGHGDRVALWLPNVPAWLSVFFACARLGAVAIAVNTRFRAHELADIVGRSRARVLVTWPDFPNAPFMPVLNQCPPASLATLSDVIVYDEHTGPVQPGTVVAPQSLAHARLHRYADLLALEPMMQTHGAAGDGCAIFTTSGTTKAPKFVLHAQFGLVAHARDVTHGFSLTPDATLLLAPPLCGVFGATTAMAMIAARRPFAMMPVWNAAQAAEFIDRLGITHMHATDEAIAQLLACTDRTPAFPSIRFAGFAAFNPTLDDIVERSQARGLRLVGLYGISEIQALFARFEEDAPIARRRHAGGVPVSPLARVRVVEPDSGAMLSEGQTGELQFFAPRSIMLGYADDPQASRDAFSPDGWYRSGDLGRVFSDGSFHFLTRIGDSLRLGGFLVSPLEIEACIQRAPGISACQVVGVPVGGVPRAIAFVIRACGRPFDETILRQHVTSQLAPYKVPARFFVVDTFPVTEGSNATKIQKHRLREMAIERLAIDAQGAA